MTRLEAPDDNFEGIRQLRAKQLLPLGDLVLEKEQGEQNCGNKSGRHSKGRAFQEPERGAKCHSADARCNRRLEQSPRGPK